MKNYDAIIIGGGHNGLVCAAYLARAGKKTLVIERRSITGGAAVTEEIVPGYRSSTYSFLMSILHPQVIADMRLRDYGLEIIPCSDMFSPLDGDDYVLFSSDVEKTQRSFARFNKKDAAALPEFLESLQDTVKAVQSLVLETPFDPTKRDFKTLSNVIGFARRNRQHGRRFFDVTDILTMSADDYLSNWFEDERIKAVFGYFASIGTFAGPKTPGSAYVIIHHVMGDHSGAGGLGFVKGGMGAITEAMEAYCREIGVDFLLDDAVGEVKVSNGRVSGVETVEGRHFSAPIIASNAAASILFRDLVDGRHLPDQFKRDIGNLKTFATAFKMNIACESAPQYRFMPRAQEQGDLAGSYPNYVHIAPDIDYLEKAYDDAKYGDYSKAPFLTPLVPSDVDPTLAPEGKHVVNIFGGHTPYKLRDGDWAVEKPKFEKLALDIMDEHAPGFSNSIVGMDCFLPHDLEQSLNMPHGNIFHGELSLDQMFFNRPVRHYSDYRTPIEGLYICGSSSHPGGGVTGIPGWNSAREILKDRSGLFSRKAS